MRIRRGPATVTGVAPGSQELSPPVTSNQGADTLSEDYAMRGRLLPEPPDAPSTAAVRVPGVLAC